MNNLTIQDGMGSLNLSLTKDDIKKPLLKELEDPSYALNTREVSARFGAQEQKILDQALWYIEWILRNSDCKYLKSQVLC